MAVDDRILRVEAWRHGINACRCAGREPPFNITCNAVLPGWVRTAMSDRRAANEARRGGISIEEVWSAWAKEYPAGRVVTPDEVANTIAFLVSDAGSGISGEPVTITLGTNQN